MKLICSEIRKLFSKKLFTACLILFLLANAFALYYTQKNDFFHQLLNENQLMYQEYLEKVQGMTTENAESILEEESSILKIVDDLKTYEEMEEGKSNEFFKFLIEQHKVENPVAYGKALKLKDEITDSFKVMSIIQNIQKKLEYIEEFDGFINEMQDRADRQLTFAIFSKPGTFSYNNIEKTPQDFEKLKGIELKVDNDLALETITTFSLTDFMIFALIILMCVSLFTYEKEKGLYSLVRSTKYGRFPTISLKLSVLVIFTVIISMVYYLSTILTCGFYSGFGDLSRNIQSSEMFLNCSFRLTVGQYLLLWVVGKIVVMCAVSLLIALLFVAIKNTSLVFVVIGSIMVAEYILYTTIDSNALFNHFKYINFFYMLEGNNIFGNYLNLNFFTLPINYTNVVAWFLLIISVVSIIISCLIFVKQNQISGRLSLTFIQKIKDKYGRISGSVKIINGECFKHYKGSFVALALLFLVFYAYDTYTTDINIVYNEASQSAYSDYMVTLQGELTPKKEKFLKNEQKYINDIQKQLKIIKNDKTLNENEKQAKIMGLQSILNGKGQALEEILEQKEYIIKAGKQIGEKPQFVNKLIYSRLLQNSPREWEFFTLLLAFIIFSSSNLFAYEHKKGMLNLIRCNRKGKFPLISSKIAVFFITATLGYILIYLPYLLNYIKTFEGATLTAPLIFVPEFQLVNSGIGIIDMVMLEGIVHICVAFCVAMLTIMLSQLLKSNILAMITASVVALFPWLLCINSKDIRLYTTFLSGQWHWFVPMVTITMFIIGIVCLLITAISFSKTFLRWGKDET